MHVNFDSFDGTVVERFAAASQWLREHPNGTLRIAPGIYNVTGEKESRLYRDIINGVYGNNPQPYTLNPDFEYTRLLDLDGTVGATIEADGVLLMLDGFFETVSVRNCTDVVIRGLTVDYLRKPYTKGIITECNTSGETGYIKVRYCEDLPEEHSCPRRAVYDFDTCRLMYNPYDIRSRKKTAPYEFVYEVNGLSDAFTGREIYAKHFFHSRPVILIQNADGVRLENITIHTSHGMGITAQNSSNIDIEHLSVVPSRGDHLSTTTDATHFVSCRGYLRMHGCNFDGHGDDAVNVHNYYHTVTPLGNRQYRLHCMATDGTHTASPDVPRVGDMMSASYKGSLEEGGSYRVIESAAEDWFNVTVTLDREISEETDKIYLSNSSACPDFTFSDCRVRNHFARSVLIKTRKASVEGCIFEKSSMTPIVVSAEEGWGEGTSSSDILIKNNVFINCAPGNSTDAVAVFTGSSNPQGVQHGRVIIEKNDIIDNSFSGSSPERHAFSIRNTREVKMCDNNEIRR